MHAESQAGERFVAEQNDISEQAAAELQARIARWQDAFNARDADGIAALHDAQCRILPPNAPPFSGAVAMAAFWKSMFGMLLPNATRSMRLRIVEQRRLGEGVVQIAEFELTRPDGSRFEAGKFLHIWQRSSGAWKIHWSAWNRNEPMTDSSEGIKPEHAWKFRN